MTEPANGAERELKAIDRERMGLMLGFSLAAAVLAVSLFRNPRAFVVLVVIVAITVKSALRRYKELGDRREELLEGRAGPV